MEREACQPGIYVVTCRPTGERWIGRASDVAAVEARGAFTLNMASSPDRSFRSAAREFGPGAFAFELLERLGPTASAKATVDSRLEHWRAALPDRRTGEMSGRT